MKNYKFVYDFNPLGNGGETLLFSTEYYDDFAVHEISLQSHGNSATLTLGDEMITPQKLRELADGLESYLKKGYVEDETEEVGGIEEPQFPPSRCIPGRDYSR